MTRRDFILISDTLRDQRPDRGNMYAPRAVKAAGAARYSMWQQTCEAISYALTKTNPRFDRERFLKACGVEE